MARAVAGAGAGARRQDLFNWLALLALLALCFV